MKSPQAQRPAGQALGGDGGGGLAEALGEFDEVLAEFSRPAGRRRFHYGEHLERMKRRSSASDGSGLSDAESVHGDLSAWPTSITLTATADWIRAGNHDGSGVTPTDILELLDCADSLYRNSFSLSDEKLNSPTASTPSLPSPSVTPCKAKLGDTKELEDFIADLDRTLASM